MAKGVRFTEDDLKRAGIVIDGDRAGRKRMVDQVNKAATAEAKVIRKIVDEDVQRKVLAAQGNIEALFQVQLLEVSWPALCDPRFQWAPIESRKLRLDVAFPFLINCKPVGIEVQGHVHRIKKNFLADMERHNLLTEAGWTMYYVSGDMIRDGRALALAKRVVR